VTRKLLIVLVNTDPRNPEELGAPFYHAAVAAAMDYVVDVICAATAGKRKPGLLNEDAFGRGWMLIVRAAGADWHNGLTTGNAVAPAFAAFIAAEGHKARADKP
jgi:hypothetical protein